MNFSKIVQRKMHEIGDTIHLVGGTDKYTKLSNFIVVYVTITNCKAWDLISILIIILFVVTIEIEEFMRFKS